MRRAFGKIMNEERKLRSRIGITALVVIFLAFESTPSVPSVPQIVDVPDPAEIAILQDLQSWLFGDASSSFAFGEVDLASAIRSRPGSFALFRDYPSEQASRDFLRRLPFGNEIEIVAERYRVDALLIAALVEVESGFDAEALSSRGAVGLMQITPITAETFGAGDTWDPRVNLDIGARYIHRLLKSYDNDLELALAAYNAGPGNVRRYGGVPPFPETESYVQKVLSSYLRNCRDVWQEEGSDRLLDLG